MKLYLIRYHVIQENPDHPLHAIYNELDHTTDPEDQYSVETFFDAMSLPEGYYAAIIRDQMGYWITFFESRQ